jgi:putative ABC transport system permease protein
MILDAFRTAFAHRSRAFLTMLGIVIGAGSIVLLASLLHGGRSFLMHADQEAGDDDVLQAYVEDPPPEQRERTTRVLSRADAVALRESSELAGASIEPASDHDVQARYAGRKKRVAIVSAGPGTASLYRLSLSEGRPLDDEDRREGRRVCVIGHEVYEDLVRKAPIRDLHLTIDGHLFEVVGVLEKKPMIGNTDSTYLWDRKVLVPETTYDSLYSPSHEVDSIYVRNSQNRQRARAVLQNVLSRRHFGVRNFKLARDQNSGMEELILRVIEILLLGSGLLALLASGINIMNVMLVTVTERTREIGLLRAIGAKPRRIMMQFLLEAVVLSGLGGIVGVACGALAGWGVAFAARAALGFWVFAVPVWSIALGFGLSSLVGIAFGLAPAYRAARIAPIEALRSS